MTAVSPSVRLNRTLRLGNDGLYVDPVNLYMLYLVLGLVAGAFTYAIRDGAALEKEVEGVV